MIYCCLPVYLAIDKPMSKIKTNDQKHHDVMVKMRLCRNVPGEEDMMLGSH